MGQIIICLWIKNLGPKSFKIKTINLVNFA